jgi:hypothetical protein
MSRCQNNVHSIAKMSHDRKACESTVNKGKNDKAEESKTAGSRLKVPRAAQPEWLPHKDGKTRVGPINGTGGTGYDNYMYAPGEAVYYRNNNKSWQLGHVVQPQCMDLTRARLWYWNVKLAADDPVDNKWRHSVFQACALIPAKCVVVEELPKK